MQQARSELEIIELGRIGFEEALARQTERRETILRGDSPHALFLLEHPPVFTLGRNASEGDVLAGADWLEERGISLIETDRGGQVTYHGPGQLVGYPILDLNRAGRRDIRRYVRDLQEVLIASLAEYGLETFGGEGERIGVWTREAVPRKIASIGIHLKRWVTTHGFALNVATELEHFDGIVTCGLQTVQMVSMADLLASPPDPREVRTVVAREFCRVFEMQQVDPVGVDPR